MKYIKHIILTAMAVLLTAGQVWALTLKIDAPNGQTMSREVEPTESIETIKTYVESWSNGLYDYRYLHLFSGDVELANDKDLYYYGFTSGTVTLTMTYDFVPARQTDGTWTFTMPNANQLLEVEYEPWTLTLSHNAGHGTVELLRPGSSAAVGTDENAFQYCYDCQRHPAYPTVANNGNNNLSGFTNPYVGLNGVGVTNDPNGPWKLEYVGKYSHSEYNFSVSGVRHTYGLNSDEDVPIFLLYQWSSATNQYEPVVYGVACAYSKLNNTHNDDHTLLFVAEGHWGCFLTNNEHTQDLNITFDEDLSSGLPNFVTAATPSLPEGVTDNGNGTYTVVSGTELTIEAIANSAEHYYFNNWTNEADEVYSGSGVVTPSGTKPATSLLTLTITGDTTVRGNFKIDTFHLTLSTNDANMGHIDIGGQQYVSKDTSLTDHQHLDVAAIPEPGYYFVNWTDANGIEKSKNTHIVVIALSDTALTAHFAPYATLQIASNYNAWGTVALQAGTTGNHELTLYDESESTSNHLIPAYTCWFDALTRSQHVIPATKLAEVKGGTISSIKYYAQDPVSWTSNKAIDVYLKEVTNTTLNSLVDKSSCTVVYNGQLNVVDGIVTITFSSPFSYNGGNLLVGIENLEAGDYNCGVRFLGEDVPGASIGGQGGNFTQQDFLPMSTFTYQTAGAIENTDGSYSVIPGTEVTVTATPANDYHFVNWTDENSNVMGTDVQLTLTVTGDTTVTGNFAATFGLPTPGVTPEGNLTVFGGRFLSETGKIVATPALTETGEFIDESVVPVPVFNCGTSTVTDFDGNTYNTVQIGNQCWMKENMRTTHYADGNDVPAGGSNTSFTAPYYYNNSSSSIPLADQGYLYNWPAAMHGATSSEASPSGVQGICPDGWHVPSHAEWTTMTNYVNNQSTYRCGGNSDSIAKALASAEGWNTSNYDCTPGKTPESNNATGFTAVPAGNRNGSFYDAGVGAYFWSATQEVSDPDKVHYRVLLFGDPNVSNYREYKNVGFSVRCLRD